MGVKRSLETTRDQNKSGRKVPTRKGKGLGIFMPATNFQYLMRVDLCLRATTLGFLRSSRVFVMVLGH